MIKSNTSLKRWFWVEEYKALKIFKKFENEDEKRRWKKWRIFLLSQNISNHIFLKLWTSLISNMYSDFSYLASIKSYIPPKAKTGKNRQNWPIFKGCNFWWKKDIPKIILMFAENLNIQSAIPKCTKGENGKNSFFLCGAWPDFLCILFFPKLQKTDKVTSVGLLGILVEIGEIVKFKSCNSAITPLIAELFFLSVKTISKPKGGQNHKN